MKESSERVAGTTALAALSMRMGCGGGRTHQALSSVLRVQWLKASSGLNKPCCGGVLAATHNRSPFAIKPQEHTLHCALVVCFRSGCSGVRPSTTENTIPHMVAELWLRMPLH